MDKDNKIKLYKRAIKLYISQSEYKKAEFYLLDYNFIRKKVILVGVHDLINDYKNLLKNHIPDEQKKEALKTLLSILEQTAHILKGYPKQINSQLVGYLEKGNNTYIDSIITAIDEKTKGVWLRPEIPSLASQQGRLIQKITERDKGFRFSALKVIKDKNWIVSGSYEGVIKIWNIKKGECIKTFHIKKDKGSIISIREIGNKYLLSKSIEDNELGLYKISIWDIENEKLYQSFKWKSINRQRDKKKEINLTPCQNFFLTEKCDNKGDKRLIVLKVPSFKFHQNLKLYLCFASYQFSTKITPLFSLKKPYEKETTRIVTICSKWRDKWQKKFGEHFIYIYEYKWGKFRKIKKILVHLDELAENIRIHKKSNTVIIKGSSLGKIEINIINLINGENLFILRKDIEKNISFEDFLVTKEGEKILLFFRNYTNKTSIIELWDIKKGEIVKTNEEDDYRIIEISEEYNYFFICGYNGKLLIWDLRTGKIIKSSNGWGGAKLMTNAYEMQILTTFRESIYLWDIKNIALNPKLISHNKGVTAIKVFDSSKKAITTSDDGMMKIIDLTTFKNYSLEVKKSIGGIDIYEKNNIFYAVIVTNTLKIFSTAKGEETIEVWNLSKNICINRFYGHRRSVVKLKVIKGGMFAITMAEDNTAKLWNIITGDCIHTFLVGLKEEFQLVNSFSMYNNEENFITGSSEGVLKIWSLEGLFIGELCGHKSTITSIKISECEKYMLSSSLDGTIKLWELTLENVVISNPILNHPINFLFLKNKNCLKTFKGSRSGVIKAMFTNISAKFDSNLKKYKSNIEDSYSGTETHILSSYYNGTIRLWEIEGEKELIIFRKHLTEIIQLHLFMNKLYVFSASSDGEIMIWNLLKGEILKSLSIGRPIVKASLTDNEKIIIIGEKSGQLHFIKIKETESPLIRIE